MPNTFASYAANVVRDRRHAQQVGTIVNRMEANGNVSTAGTKSGENVGAVGLGKI